MKKLFFKLFILLFLMISLPVFALLGFQHENQIRMEQIRPAQDAYPMPPQNAPPIAIPLVLFSFVACVLSYFFISYLSENYILPLLEIQKKIDEVKKENYDISFNIENSNPSIKSLFETLNSMIASLKEKQSLQESFIQGLTHDLRSPALVQDRAINILENEYKDNELIRLLKNNNESYLNLINLIIESYANLEIKINKTKFKLQNILNNVLQALMPTIKEKNIAINVDIIDDLTVLADFTSLNRILLNILSNALDNIDDNKSIKIKAYNQNNNTYIVIEDKGKGISEDFLPFIFEKKASLHTTGQKAVSGLGLNLCKVLTEKQGGTIIAESEINKYTRFTIALPLEE